MESNTATLGSVELKQHTDDRSPQAMARFAGLLYIAIAVFAGIAQGYVPAQLVVPGDAAATANNILASSALFRIGIASELATLLCEVALVILLYILLRPVSNTLALIAAAFRLTMTAIHGVNLLSPFAVLLLLGASPAVFAGDQLHALVALLLKVHSIGFTIGIAFFVPHVFLVGYLIVRSGYFPRVFGGLFLLAGCGYFIDVVARLFLPGYSETPAALALPIIIAEIAFPLWLLVKGVNIEQWNKRAPAPA
ncbi:DUF4386 domain-containing protein [Candidatus Chloroploca sp. Khr17]|uniref:DUF4386 domain-containing protein n=1 Tax=Candidatus Chloroploca sp. Khr17 TaxID=2496869 RepID=UPI00101D222E|nr:DUF4386 domain-containing protein [Candidatus Chloroploca sp. Khr17]